MVLESKLLDLGLDVSGLWRPGDQARAPRFGDSGATRMGTGADCGVKGLIQGKDSFKFANGDRVQEL